jgi:hypothetical protein
MLDIIIGITIALLILYVLIFYSSDILIFYLPDIKISGKTFNNGSNKIELIGRNQIITINDKQKSYHNIDLMGVSINIGRNDRVIIGRSNSAENVASIRLGDGNRSFDKIIDVKGPINETFDIVIPTKKIVVIYY